MFVCACVYIYTYMNVYIHVCVYTQIYMCIHTYTYIRGIHIYMCLYKYCFPVQTTQFRRAHEKTTIPYLAFVSIAIKLTM